MDIRQSHLSMMLDRGNGAVTLKHLRAFTAPAHAQKAAEFLRDIIMAVEKKTGIVFDDQVYLSHPGTAIQTYRDPPSLLLDYRFIENPQAYSKAAIEFEVSHECGHQHYESLMRKFRQPLQMAKNVRLLMDISKLFTEAPQEIAARLLQFGQTPEAFAAGMKQMVSFIQETMRSGDQGAHFSELANAGNAQVAAWLAQAHKEVAAGLSMSAPVKAYQGCVIPDDFEQKIHILQASLQHWHGTAATIEAARQHVPLLQAMFDEIMPEIRKAMQFYGKLMKGEELLCDDYSILHSDAPKECLAAMREAFAKAGDEAHNHDHPACAERLERAEMLVKRIEAGKQMSGSLAADEPVNYRAWLNKMAQAPVPAASTATPRRLS